MPKDSFRELQQSNKRKTVGLLLGMAVLIWLISYAALTYFGVSGVGVLPVAVGISLITVWGSYYSSDSLVVRMTGARIIQEADNPNLFKDRKSTRLNSSHIPLSRMPSSA